MSWKTLSEKVKENMSLVWNRQLIKKFADEVLVDLEGDEVYSVVLVARKKYCSRLARSQEMLDMLVVKRKEDFVRKVCRFLRIEEGDYIDFKTGEPIPLESMACYVDIYPKSCIKAGLELNKLFLNWLVERGNNPEFDDKVFTKLNTKLFASIHKSNSRKPHKIVDIDTKDFDFSTLPRSRAWITETRGGYHVIYLTPDSDTIKELVDFRKSSPESVEFAWHQGQTVIPGTLQGGFKVRLYDLW